MPKPRLKRRLLLLINANEQTFDILSLVCFGVIFLCSRCLLVLV
jgi:hypothetical protein